MCKDATATAGSLLAAIEPELPEFLSLIGVSSTESATVTKAFTDVATAVSNWVPGTAPTEAQQAITDFDTVFDALPVPAQYQELAAVISSGILAVLGVLKANEPSNVTVLHAATMAHQTTKAIAAKVPDAPKMDLRHPETAAAQFTTFYKKKLEAAKANTPATVVPAN